MNNRPVYLNLFHLHLPLPGWVSILHRVTGVVLFIGLPVFLYLLQQSLSDFSGFLTTKSWLSGAWGSLYAWLLMVSLGFHVLAGIRHMALDMHWGVEKNAARRSALLVLIASALTAVLSAGWLSL